MMQKMIETKSAFQNGFGYSLPPFTGQKFVFQLHSNASAPWFSIQKQQEIERCCK